MSDNSNLFVKYISYSDDRDSLTGAFSFVMDYVDEFASPSIVITGYRHYSNVLHRLEDEKGELRFSVSVSGEVN